MLAVAQTHNLSDSLSTITQGHVRVKIETPLGDIVVRLYDATPLHRDNFVRLVKEGYYDNTLFHLGTKKHGLWVFFIFREIHVVKHNAKITIFCYGWLQIFFI